MDEALNLPPMKQPAGMEEMLSSRGQVEEQIVKITPVQAPQYTAAHVEHQDHADKKKHGKEEPHEHGKADKGKHTADSNDSVKVDKSKSAGEGKGKKVEVNQAAGESRHQ